MWIGYWSNISYVSSTFGWLNLVMTSRSLMGLPAITLSRRVVVQVWADPPTAVCGQPGSNCSGSVASRPSSRRKSLTSPPAVTTTMWLSKTPFGGTLGLLGLSDQSTVAQPDSGCCWEQACSGRPESRSVSTNLLPGLGPRAAGTVALTVTAS